MNEIVRDLMAIDRTYAFVRVGSKQQIEQGRLSGTLQSANSHDCYRSIDSSQYCQCLLVELVLWLSVFCIDQHVYQLNWLFEQVIAILRVMTSLILLLITSRACCSPLICLLFSSRV